MFNEQEHNINETEHTNAENANVNENENAQATQNGATSKPETSDRDEMGVGDIFAKQDGDSGAQNTAFTQSAGFHRETPYAADANANTDTGANANGNANAETHGGAGYTQGMENPVREKAPKEKKKHGFLKKVAATVALALIFGVVSGGIFMGMNHGSLNAGGSTSETTANGDSGTSSTSTSFTASQSGTLKSATETMKDALEAAKLASDGTYTVPQINIIMEPAMVSINCKVVTTVNSYFFGSQSYESSSAGSGIIVGENETELLIVTNNHVISDASEISVQMVNGESYSALVKGTDATNDLAVIVVNLTDIPEETMNAITYAELGDSDALVVGESVVAIGNALGKGQSVTTGVISAKNRAVSDSDGNTTYLLQTDAAINPGNSGGALVNMKGQVIGINSAKYSDESVEGMGFAIPVNTALPILEDLMSRTTRTVNSDEDKQAYLGVSVTDIDSTAQQMYQMPAGVYVYSTTDGLAAANAGILTGDIITKFDGEAVTSKTDLVKLLTYYEAGETVDVTIERYEAGQYTEKVLSVTLSQKPTEEENTASGSGGNTGNGGNGRSSGNGNNGGFGLDDFFGN